MMAPVLDCIIVKQNAVIEFCGQKRYNHPQFTENATTIHIKLYYGQKDVPMGRNSPKQMNKCH